MFKLILLSSVFVSASLFAGTADLAIELEFNEVSGIVVEEQGEFVARITNNGPDVAAETAPISFPISLSSGVVQDNGSFTPDIQFAAGTQNNKQECFFILIIGEPPPGGSVSYVYNIYTQPIAVNETIECHGIFSRHFQSGTRDVNWNIRNSYDSDPNSNNNSQVITFGVPPKSVPVNNTVILVLLYFLLLYFGYKSKRL